MPANHHRLFTPEQDWTITQERLAGSKLAALAEKYHCSIAAIVNATERCGFRRLREEQRAARLGLIAAQKKPKTKAGSGVITPAPYRRGWYGTEYSSSSDSNNITEDISWHRGMNNK